MSSPRTATPSPQEERRPAEPSSQTASPTSPGSTRAFPSGLLSSPRREAPRPGWTHRGRYASLPFSGVTAARLPSGRAYKCGRAGGKQAQKRRHGARNAQAPFPFAEGPDRTGGAARGRPPSLARPRERRWRAAWGAVSSRFCRGILGGPVELRAGAAPASPKRAWLCCGAGESRGTQFLPSRIALLCHPMPVQRSRQVALRCPLVFIRLVAMHWILPALSPWGTSCNTVTVRWSWPTTEVACAGKLPAFKRLYGLGWDRLLNKVGLGLPSFLRN